MIPLDILWMHNRFSSILLCRSLILDPITCSLQTVKHNPMCPTNPSTMPLIQTVFSIASMEALTPRRVMLPIYHILDSPESWQVFWHHICISPSPLLTGRSATSSVVAPCASFHEWTSTLFPAQTCMHLVNKTFQRDFTSSILLHNANPL